jgi:hypothetical protein
MQDNTTAYSIPEITLNLHHSVLTECNLTIDVSKPLDEKFSLEGLSL